MVVFVGTSVKFGTAPLSCGALSSHFKPVAKDLGVLFDNDFRSGKQTECVVKTSIVYFLLPYLLMFSSAQLAMVALLTQRCGV